MSKIYLSPTSEQDVQYTDSDSIQGRKLWKAQRAIEGRLETAEFKITPEAIVATVTSSDDYTTLESQVSANATAITLKVSSSDYNGNTIASLINQTATTIQISASKIQLSGYVTFTNLSTSGQTSINGGNIQTSSISSDKISVGTLSALTANVGTLTAGLIGGWTINNSTISRNHISLGDDYISLGSATGTTAATINFHGGSVKLYNNASSTAIGVSGNMIIDSSLYVLGTAIVDDIRPSVSGVNLGASSYRWGLVYADTLWCNVVGSSSTASERPNVYAATLGATFGGTFYYLTRDANGFVKAV